MRTAIVCLNGPDRNLSANDGERIVSDSVARDFSRLQLSERSTQDNLVSRWPAMTSYHIGASLIGRQLHRGSAGKPAGGRDFQRHESGSGSTNRSGRFQRGGEGEVMERGRGGEPCGRLALGDAPAALIGASCSPALAQLIRPRDRALAAAFRQRKRQSAGRRPGPKWSRGCTWSSMCSARPATDRLRW